MRRKLPKLGIGGLLIFIAAIALPLAMVMRALNPPKAKAVIVGPSLFHFSSMKTNTKSQHPWIVRNEGNGTLRLKLSISTQCTWCNLQNYEEKTVTSIFLVPPGAEFTIMQSWRSYYRPGKQLELIKIETNDPENPELTFTVQGDVLP